ncbi:MAG: Nascent polypeptide-associated complex protein [Methanonatronarchaeales archaeon]|nr:Nascent polypeptide-associated complex protein [Methanonatronarchaeales archaeon]
MFPGGGNPRQMKRMMKQMGIEMETLEDAEEVVIKREGSDIVIRAPQVSVMNAQGQEVFQVVGESEERAAEYEPSEEDVVLVEDQTGASAEEVREALRKSGGDIAEAIMELS